RAAGTARGGRSVIHDFILQHVSDMSLRGCRSNQFFVGEMRNDLAYFGSIAGNFFAGFRSRAGENSFDASGITNQHHRVTGDTSVLAIIKIQERGGWRSTAVEPESGNIGL